MVDFIKSNNTDDSLQKTSKFLLDQDTNELRNDITRKEMPSRLRMLSGQADVANANGQVAQSTIGDNIAQEHTATQQGRANLRSTNLRNTGTEVEALGQIASAYEQGLDAEGDTIASKYGYKPQQLEPLKKDREFRGVVLRSVADAKTQFATPDKQQKFVEERVKGYTEGRTKANDYGANYTAQPNDPARDTDPIYSGRGGGSRGAIQARPLQIEAKKQMLIESGMDPQEAARVAAGVRMPNELEISKLVEKQLATEDRMGVRSQEDTIERRQALMDAARRQFGTGSRLGEAAPAAPAAAPAPAPATPPPASPSIWERLNPFSSAPAPAAAPAQAPAPAPDQSATPNGGYSPPAPQALPQLPQGAPQLPSAPAFPAKSMQEAMQQRPGTPLQLPNGKKAVRIDRPEDLDNYPPGTIGIFGDGRKPIQRQQ